MKVSAAMFNHCMVGVNCLKYGYALALTHLVLETVKDFPEHVLQIGLGERCREKDEVEVEGEGGERRWREEAERGGGERRRWEEDLWVEPAGHGVTEEDEVRHHASGVRRDHLHMAG